MDLFYPSTIIFFCQQNNNSVPMEAIDEKSYSPVEQPASGLSPPA